ncbi:uncharacterized protein LOC132613196 [Lycium barbarum]|uniref:uncharacterized protein LOC132613196 n=1 Tax=Lycium barbarum TaxID=112863 RepID=UPI00293EF371|nr:uncharacterized protein LOC132613196 [Lycium barbarum]
MEPFQHQNQIQKYRRKLGMPYANSNCNGKIWFFVQDNIDVEVLLDIEQAITVKLQFQDFNKEMVVTMVYAKCSDVERMQLWDSLYLLANNMTAPWLVGGDFNVILNEEEKIGGLPVLPQEYEDFAFCLNSCELHEMPFKGSPFTWWNGRAANDCIFKRLDRIVYNDAFQNWFGQLEVEHLSRTGSDHAPLLVSCGDQGEKFIKPFRFLKFWVGHDNFLDFVKHQWETALTDDVFLSFKLKMKKLKIALSTWSKNTFGDIFKQLVIREEIVKIKEQLFEETPSAENRMVMQRAQAELKLSLHYEEEFWRQKARMDCFSEGDRNTRYFHSLVKGRRKRIQIRRIKDDAGNWIEDVDSVAAQAVNFFHKQFTHEGVSEDSPIFHHIQELIKEEDNILLAAQPTMEEVKRVVFELNGDSACGPDGFSGIFYQKCWEVIKADVYSVVKAFFEGQTLPKSITHTNLVLLPKKNIVEAFSDMRHISLSNFINKVISRVVHDRLDKLLTKAHGFFHSTRGVMQGDPLSPALFIIAAEDDTIIFSSADNQSLQMIMNTLQEYEKVSGQLINKSKSSFYMFSKVSHEVSQQVAIVTGFVRGQFPFTYLGVPITHARKRKVDYTELLKKVKDRFFWNNKEEGRCRHWAAWLNMCIPKHEGGLGFRSIHDTSKALCAKLWWKFRTTSSLWANFMWNKYCKKQIPQLVQWKGGSQLGALSYVVPQSWHINEHAEDVSELMTDGRWNVNKLIQMFPEDIVQHILQEIDIKCASNEWDRPWWMMTSTGKFTVSSAWHLLRQKANVTVPFQNMWIKGVPFKISFFMWRLWKFKVPIDEVVASIGIPLVSKCCCCHNAQIDTINHLFLCGDLAAKVWRYFNMGAGLSLNCVQIVQFFEGYKPTVICKIITWRRPAYGVYKSSKMLTDGTNIVAEAEAIRMGLSHCVEKQLFPLIIETDSMTMKMILNAEWKVPWSISILVEDIRRMMEDQIVQFSFIVFRNYPVKLRGF